MAQLGSSLTARCGTCALFNFRRVSYPGRLWPPAAGEIEVSGKGNGQGNGQDGSGLPRGEPQAGQSRRRAGVAALSSKTDHLPRQKAPAPATEAAAAIRPSRIAAAAPQDLASSKPANSKGLRSLGFLSHGGSASGEPPRRARGRKVHTQVVTAPPAQDAAAKPGDLSIRPKRLPSLREEKAQDKQDR